MEKLVQALPMQSHYEFWKGKAAWAVSWKYDAKNNTYIRSHGDKVVHTDLNNKTHFS